MAKAARLALRCKQIFTRGVRIALHGRSIRLPVETRLAGVCRRGRRGNPISTGGFFYSAVGNQMSLTCVAVLRENQGPRPVFGSNQSDDAALFVKNLLQIVLTSPLPMAALASSGQKAPDGVDIVVASASALKVGRVIGSQCSARRPGPDRWCRKAGRDLR